MKLIGTATTALLSASLVAALPVAADTTGSGGPSSDLMNQAFTAANGLSSRYHIYAAALPRDREVGLLVQFHGDGAYEFRNPASSYSLGGSSGIVAKARARGMLTVAALSPDKRGSVTWWEQGSANADYARDLIRAVAFNKYNIDTNNIWLVGFSGGSQFITQFFLPKHSSMIRGGGAVVFGGGGTPRIAVQPFAAALRADFDMHWYTGLNDDGRDGSYNGLRDARAGSTYYRTRGFSTTIETPAGVGHDDLPFGTVVGQQLAKHAASPTPPPAPPIAGLVGPRTAHTVSAARNGATVTLNVPAGTPRVTFRVSRSPLRGQTGWYQYTNRTGKNVRLAIRYSLAAGTKYYYRVEKASRGNVIASGTFRTRS